MHKIYFHFLSFLFHSVHFYFIVLRTILRLISSYLVYSKIIFIHYSTTTGSMIYGVFSKMRFAISLNTSEPSCTHLLPTRMHPQCALCSDIQSEVAKRPCCITPTPETGKLALARMFLLSVPYK